VSHGLRGQAEQQFERVVEWYTNREAADAELATILNEEPSGSRCSRS
jgi:hypothetical protein